MNPSIVALQLSHANRAPMKSVAKASAVEGSGLEGDRHAKPGTRRALLLMDQEVLEQFGLSAGDVREQVTVKGLALTKLAEGTRLKVGDAILEVGKPCAPCERMDEIRSGLRAELEGRRGTFVRVVKGGTVSVGDAITMEPAG